MKATRDAPRIQVSGYFFRQRLQDSTDFEYWVGKQAFETAGYDFADPPNAHEFWIFDLTLSALLGSLRFPRSKRRLFVFEPAAVNPLQHNSVIRRMFGKVYVFSSAQLDAHTTFVRGGGVFMHPGPPTQPSVSPTVDVVMANANKISLHPKSLYHLRVDALLGLAEKGFSVGLAGNSWCGNLRGYLKASLVSFARVVLSGSLPRPAYFRLAQIRRLCRHNRVFMAGSVEHLGVFYQRGRVVLVIENDRDFFSEKLFAAMQSGRPVVYVGPLEAKSEIQASGVVFATPNFESIVAAIRQCLNQAVDSTKIQNILAHRTEAAFLDRLVQAVSADSEFARGA